MRHRGMPFLAKPLRRRLICFYKSLIRQHLEFCTATWSPHYVKDKLLIEKVREGLHD